MILIIDHQDSFTYNIYAALKKEGAEVEVCSTLDTRIDDIKEKNLTGIILSPGPGRPSEAKLFFQALTEFKDKLPILGVCLGHQAIAEYFGGRVTAAKKIIHGKSVQIEHSHHKLFSDIHHEFSAMRYNSLIVENPLPPELTATAWSEGEIMGLTHNTLPIFGVQFHPESVGSVFGKNILINFLKITQK